MKKIYHPTSSFGVLLLFALFLTSCFTPKSVVRIKPLEEENVRWNYGQAYARLRLSDLEVQAAYAAYDKNYLIFDVEVINYSNEEVLVSPENIYLEADGRTYKAIDPERKLLGMEIDHSRREASRKNLAVAIGAAAVVGAVAVIASDSGNNSNDNDNDNVDNVDLAVTSLYVGATVAPAVAEPPLLPSSGPETPWFWSDYALRKTTLAANEKVAGKVMFLRNDALARMELVAPVAQEVFHLKFQQQVYKP